MTETGFVAVVVPLVTLFAGMVSSVVQAGSARAQASAAAAAARDQREAAIAQYWAQQAAASGAGKKEAPVWLPIAAIGLGALAIYQVTR